MRLENLFRRGRDLHQTAAQVDVSADVHVVGSGAGDETVDLPNKLIPIEDLGRTMNYPERRIVRLRQLAEGLNFPGAGNAVVNRDRLHTNEMRARHVGVKR